MANVTSCLFDFFSSQLTVEKGFFINKTQGVSVKDG